MNVADSEVVMSILAAKAVAIQIILMKQVV
jgi:hypothetical protein